jgi:hypothetical protein
LTRQRKNDSIGSNTKVAIAPGDCFLRAQQRLWPMTVIHQYEIVTQAVILAELHSLPLLKDESYY